MKSPFKEQWKEAIESEINSLKENNTWEIAKIPDEKRPIKTKWVFKVKKNSKGEPERFKARLVAKGYEQQKGIDFNETFAPVVKIQSLRLLIAIAVQEGMQIHHIDISTAFLYGEVEEEIYIERPDGYDVQLSDDQALRLEKALYGLKQAPRNWNKTLMQFLQELGFKSIETDHCIMFNHHLIIAIYVDDITIACKQEAKIVEFKKLVSEKFKTKDLGKLSFILGIKVEHSIDGTIRLSQKSYIEKIMLKFNLENTKSTDIPIQPNHNLTRDLRNEKPSLRKLFDVTTYRQAIGSLIYLMT